MRLNYGKTFLLGFGFFGVSVIWMVYNTFVPGFLENKFGLEPSLIGFFMTLDNIAALLIQPPVGAWSDRLRTPIGRRMPFILIGAPIGAVAFGLIPMAAILPLFVACTSTLLISMAFWRTPVIALMPDITPSKYRSQANGVINFMGGLGSIVATLGGSRLYDINPAFPFWLGSVLVVLAALMVFIFIREPKVYEESTNEDRPSMWVSLKDVFTNPEKSGLRILLSIFFWFVAYNAVEAFFTLYAQNHLELTISDGARLLGQMSLLFVLFALPSGFIGGKIGRKNTILIGLSLMILLTGAMFVIPPETQTIVLTKLPILGTVPVVGVILMIAGIAWACVNINSLPMVVDLTTHEKLGIFTSLYYLFSTLAAITGPIVNGFLVDLTGDNYAMVMVIAPLFFLCAFISMAGVKRGEARDQA
jgi:maltose/moltooligosaccharide transporter